MNALKPWHIGVLLVVVLLLFGAKRLPDLAKSVGQSLKIFKNEIKDLTDEPKATDPTVPPVSAAPPVAPPAAPPVAPPAPPVADDGTGSPRT